MLDQLSTIIDSHLDVLVTIQAFLAGFSPENQSLHVGSNFISNLLIPMSPNISVLILQGIQSVVLSVGICTAKSLHLVRTDILLILGVLGFLTSVIGGLDFVIEPSIAINNTTWGTHHVFFTVLDIQIEFVFSGVSHRRLPHSLISVFDYILVFLLALTWSVHSFTDVGPDMRINVICFIPI